MRAFLSHSSRDKGFVGEVAESLGRARVLYDVYEFSTGDEFSAAIKVGLERADVFVLFASKASLASDWVNFEIAEAERALATKALTKAVCYIIDDTVKVDDLPPWMRHSLATTQTNPRLVSIDIHRILNQRLSHRNPRLFVGRDREMDEALDLITEDVNPLITYGLPGMGRRTFLHEIARNNLSYSKYIDLPLRSGDELPELLLYLNNHLGAVDAVGATDFVKERQSHKTSELVIEAHELLTQFCSAGIFPVIVDEGALTSDDGRLLPTFSLLFSSLIPDPSTHLGIVSPRRIRMEDAEPYAGVRIAELDTTATQKLLRLLVTHNRIALQRDQLESIASYVAGYPPAATFALQELRTYGPDHVINNQRSIVKFNERLFVAQVGNGEKITPDMQNIMQLLSAYSPLPLPVIGSCLGIQSDERLAEALAFLIDFAFVVPEGLHYRISAPPARRILSHLRRPAREPRRCCPRIRRVSGSQQRHG